MAVAKALIFVMTTLIAVLTGLIVYGLYQKSQDPNFKMFGSNDTPAIEAEQPALMMPTQTTGDIASFGEISLDLPATARVVSASTSGHRLILVIARDGQAADLVAVIDLNTGKVLGRVKTTP